MRYKPHSYQTYATQFIINHPWCVLLLDMGLGKTVITLTAIRELIYDFFEIRRVLVVAPLRVARDTWPAELAKWQHLKPLTIQPVSGTPQQRRKALARPADIYVINRENLDWLAEQDTHPFDMIVLDELSSFKNHKTKRFKAACKLRKQACRIVGLTGTPTSNGLLDLWAQYKLIDGGKRLGKFITGYRDRFFIPDARNGAQIYSWRPKPGASDEIFQQVKDITISMRAADHLKLPKLTRVILKCRMPKTTTTTYRRLKNEMIADVSNQEIDALNAGVLAAKLQQLAAGAIYDENHNVLPVHDAKLDLLEDIREAANGRPLLVAYWFKHDATRIEARFPDAKRLESAEDMASWNAGRLSLALLHPASAGHGLNLQQGGSTLVWFTPPWSLELYQQTCARLYRQGQEKPVQIIHLVTDNTIDQQILKALKAKNTTQAALISAVKANLQEAA